MLKGNIVALITPYDENNKINFNKLEALIEFQIQSKVSAIVLLGTTAEASSLTKKEQLQIIKFAIKVIRRRVKIIVGCSAINTLEAKLKANKISKYKVDYLLVLTPYYLKTNSEGIIEHFKEIASVSNKPIIIYHVPSRTGQKIPIECYGKLTKIKNIIGVKEASGDIEYIKKLNKYISDDFILLSGNDDIMIEIMENKGSGVISVFSNTHPDIVSNVMELCLNKEYKKAKELLKKYMDYIKLLFVEPNPIPIKEAMNYLEFNVGGYRLPLYSMSNLNKKVLHNEIEELFK